jgi:hypothetical protein
VAHASAGQAHAAIGGWWIRPERWDKRGASPRGYRVELSKSGSRRSVEVDGEAVAEAVVLGAGEEFGGEVQRHFEGVGAVVVLGDGEFLELVEKEFSRGAVGFKADPAYCKSAMNRLARQTE